MRKIFTLLILAILATATAFAGVYKTALFGKTYNSKSVGAYNVSWSATNDGFTVNLTNWNNNNNGWEYVKCGSKNNASVATISTDKPIDKAVSKVVVTVDKITTAKITSTKLYVASNSSFTENVQTIEVKPAQGPMEFTVPSPAANLYYKFEANCAKGSENGLIQVSKLEYYEADTRTATTLSFGADLDGKTITKYVGETDNDFTHTATLSPAVEGATITYTSSNDKVATVYNDYVLVETGAEGTATIKATYAGNDTYKPSEASYAIEVKELPINFSIADNAEVMEGTKLTISSIEGATLKYQINNEAEVTVNTNTVDITLDKDCAIDATALYNGATSEDIRSYTVVKAPASIAITGTPATTEYWVGDKFKTDGLTVTAAYDDASTEDVTAKSTLAASPATLTEAGEQTVTVTATYGDLTATATYTATVKAPLKYVIDLTKNETTTATTAKLEWVKSVATVTASKANATTDANNYYGGVGGKTSTRFYSKSTLTFTPAEGYAIKSVVYTATSENYANAMAKSTWTNATATASGTTVTITPTDGTQAFYATISGTTGGEAFVISYDGAEVANLADVTKNGEVGNTYNVADGVVVAKFEAADKHYLVVKDNAEAVHNSSAPADGDKFFNIAGQKQQEYAQNNWMLVSVPVEQYNQVNANTALTAVTGTLTDALNTTLEATSVTAGEATEAYTVNAYCPTNFMGNSHVTAADGNTYYFATPKANEYVKVVWAVYNATDGAFYLPAHSGSINTQGFEGAFKVDYSMNSAEAPVLVDGSMYEFEAVVKEVATSDAQSAPRKVDANTNVEPSSKFVVCPVNLTGDKVVTGVSEVNGAKTVKSVSYFNMMGVQAAEPFSGVNIVVTTYTDGTSTAAKVIR